MICVREAMPDHYPWIAQKANLFIGGAFRAIEAVDGDRILGMVGYDGWTPNSCSMHVAIDSPIAIRRLIRPAFGIPFIELKKEVVFGSVLTNNPKALEFDLRLGFRKVCTLKDAWAHGIGIHILEMRRKNWEKNRWAV